MYDRNTAQQTFYLHPLFDKTVDTEVQVDGHLRCREGEEVYHNVCSPPPSFSSTVSCSQALLYRL